VYPMLSAAWLVLNLEYLVTLEGRVAFHADRLFSDAPAAELRELRFAQSTG